MKKLALTLLLISTSAFAVDPLITPTKDLLFTTPTQRECSPEPCTGQPLGLSEIQKITALCSSASGNYVNPTDQTNVTLPDTTVTINLTDYPDGNIFCVATVTDINGLESSYSNEVSDTILRVGKPKVGTLRWK